MLAVDMEVAVYKDPDPCGIRDPLHLGIKVWVHPDVRICVFNLRSWICAH